MIRFKPIWSDSMGAKSFCTLVETPDIKALIDPGASIMQPGFPAPADKKISWLGEAGKAIKKAGDIADMIIISHYHYDHFTDFDRDLYKGKRLYLKNPNRYINRSQRRRSEAFLDRICKSFGDINLEDLLCAENPRGYDDLVKKPPSAMGEDSMDEGRAWFRELTGYWNKIREIPELKFDEIEVRYPEGGELKIGETTVRFTNPLFHGTEYARIGWVFSTIVEHGKEKLIHSSDISGPIIEDYGRWLIKENPTILLLDGPATYLLPYILTPANLRRAVDNIKGIIEKTSTECIILDHHLTRDRRYRETLKEVYKTAKKQDKEILTVAEYLGKTPVLDLQTQII